MSDPDDASNVRYEEGLVLPVTYQTAATILPLEAPTALAASLPSRLADIFSQEASHQSVDGKEDGDDFGKLGEG